MLKPEMCKAKLGGRVIIWVVRSILALFQYCVHFSRIRAVVSGQDFVTERNDTDKRVLGHKRLLRALMPILTWTILPGQSSQPTIVFLNFLFFLPAVPIDAGGGVFVLQGERGKPNRW